jgi:hypothetical protein
LAPQPKPLLLGSSLSLAKLLRELFLTSADLLLVDPGLSFFYKFQINKLRPLSYDSNQRLDLREYSLQKRTRLRFSFVQQLVHRITGQVKLKGDRALSCDRL